VQGSGFRVQGARFRVQGPGFRVQGPEFRVQGSGCRVDDGEGRTSSGVGALVRRGGGGARVCHFQPLTVWKHAISSPLLSGTASFPSPYRFETRHFQPLTVRARAPPAWAWPFACECPCPPSSSSAERDWDNRLRAPNTDNRLRALRASDGCQQRLVFDCRTISASTAPCISRRRCCPAHCASYSSADQPRTEDVSNEWTWPCACPCPPSSSSVDQPRTFRG